MVKSAFPSSRLAVEVGAHVLALLQCAPSDPPSICHWQALGHRSGSAGVQSIPTYCLHHCNPSAVLSLALFLRRAKWDGKLKNKVFKF